MGVAGGAVAIDTTSLPGGTIGTLWGPETIAVSGAAGATEFFLAGGSWPVGLALNVGTGEISGTPSLTGTFDFTLRVIDSAGNYDEQSYSVRISGTGGGGSGDGDEERGCAAKTRINWSWLILLLALGAIVRARSRFRNSI